MFNFLALFVLVVYVTTSFSIADDFETEFSRLINVNSDQEHQVYGSSGSNEEHTVFFPQKLDHFKSTARNLWDQRSIVLNTHYKKNGPFFVYLFGNKPASIEWLRNSRIMSYAKDAQALVIGLEHRYYGDSRPFANTSLENLNYLDVQQALADIAYFIRTVNEISLVPENTKWVLFGGFYGGSLAAWARLRYPHLVYGAVASGALMSIKSEYPEYLESVRNSYFSFNYTCAKNIKSAFQQIEDLLQTQEGRTKISQQFRLCGSLESNEEDKAIFRGILSEQIALAVERNHRSYDESMSSICYIMNRDSDSALENLKTVSSRFLPRGYCWYTKETSIVSAYQKVHYDSREQSDRLWQYQLCTQLGLNLPSTKSSDMFGQYKPEAESLAKYCQDIFGPEYNQQTIDEGVKEMELEFGGSAFNTNRLAFIYGSQDPWRGAGITEKVKNALYDVVNIKGASHLADLESSRKDADLENGIQEIKDILKSWLQPQT
ncbi:putative serine protease K12H4.7 [Planococcus citri]|uniref:putative serine protease K12H4.7 n=1 Tax=Planococcus citri TaxID=170843 RepID=UPI0031F7A1A6